MNDDDTIAEKVSIFSSYRKIQKTVNDAHKLLCSKHSGNYLASLFFECFTSFFPDGRLLFMRVVQEECTFDVLALAKGYVSHFIYASSFSIRCVYRGS